MLEQENELLNAALEYAEKGILVFPLEKYGKHMIKDSFFHKPSTSPDIIRQWWDLIWTHFFLEKSIKIPDKIKAPITSGPLRKRE